MKKKRPQKIKSSVISKEAKEHRTTYNKLKRAKKFPSLKTFAKDIARDHKKEKKKY